MKRWLLRKHFLKNIYLFILEREGRRDIDMLFHLFIHSLIDSCVFPDQGSNPHPDVSDVSG